MVAILKEQPFVAPSEIIARVKKIRSDRITRYGPIDVPNGLDGTEYNDYMRETIKRIADGEDVPHPPQLPAREMPNFDKVMPLVDPPPLPPREPWGASRPVEAEASW